LPSSGSGPSAEGEGIAGELDLQVFLAKLGSELTSELVLVGGQAVSFWAWRYSARLPGVLTDANLPTKDIDFCGDREAVRLCAARLGGQAFVPDMDDHTPNTGKVVFVDEQGVKQRIDFLGEPFGVSAAELRRMALPFEVEAEGGQRTGLLFYVMHPVLCLESRVANTVGLPGYQTPHALAQLRASIGCAREFLRDVLDVGAVRDVLNLNERIFRCAMDPWKGERLVAAQGIDVFAAVLADDKRLPEKFRTIRYPQMQKIVEDRRAAQLHQHTSFGEQLEGRWKRAFEAELARLGQQGRRVEELAGIQIRRAREQLRQHDRVHPRRPGPLATLLSRRDEARLTAWSTEHVRLERRLDQLVKRERTVHGCTRDAVRAERRAERRDPELARRVREYRAWKKERATERRGPELDAGRGQSEREMDRER